MKTWVLCIIYLFIGLPFLSAQNIVTPNAIDNPIHRQYSGKIVFLSQPSDSQQIAASDFIDSFELKEGQPLAARFFLANSLTNYLHQLDQTLSVEQLIQNGNYQFSFYVDNKLIYTENLTTGAGTVQSKNQWTQFRIPLISITNEDSWGRFLWGRFYYGNGGSDALFGGKHLLKIEVRPYLKTVNGIKTGTVIASGELNFSTPVIQLTAKQIALQVIQPGSNWPLSKEPLNRKKIEELNKRIAEKRFKNITSIAVIKNGKLLLEEYFNEANRNTLHDTRSVGKSFASTLTGIAIQDRYIKSENQSLKDFYELKKYDHYDVQKDSVTLKNLLTMSSVFDGFDFDSDSPGNEENMYPTANWVQFTLNLPVDRNKRNGEQWNYFTAGVVLIGDILHQNVPGGLETYADQKLFHPLGIRNYKWQYTPQKVANTAGGLQLNTLDLARYGQLYQNKGKWNGKQLIPQSWVTKSFTNYFPENEHNKGYGYLFWRELFTVNGKNYEAYACSGNGGNKIYIFQELPLVIVITATAYNQSYAHSQVEKIVTEYLLPALLNP
ncbi:serine hydrolase domain-containing protein [Flavobacterium cerinum]|uniref:Beta-lactamase family protein n=1 Tax=Flavobacterium cerinum TaxID=2502784 RepID=A0ABY5IRB1_9FLAO|nr:serine hydrolase [Flavobacterium cerinum]UUC44087.1 beta-lactamase family protein [Flavobacterium cerinum]